MSDRPLLAVHNATRRFGAVTALDDVSLTIKPREFVAIVGGTIALAVAGALGLALARIRDRENP